MAYFIVGIAELYAAVGAVVAAWFLLLRLDRVDAARGAYAFRPLLIPGLMLLWPLVLLRCARTGPPRPRPCGSRRHERALCPGRLEPDQDRLRRHAAGRDRVLCPHLR